MASLFKKAGVKLKLLTDIDMLLLVEKRIRGRIVHAIHRYAKANNEYMKNYGKNFESSYLEYLDEQFVWMGMSQTLPVNGSKWKKNVFKFEEDFIKNYDVDSDKGYILAVDGEYSKNLHDLHSDLPFLAEEWKLINLKSLYAIYMIKITILFK